MQQYGSGWKTGVPASFPNTGTNVTLKWEMKYMCVAFVAKVSFIIIVSTSTDGYKYMVSMIYYLKQEKCCVFLLKKCK